MCVCVYTSVRRLYMGFQARVGPVFVFIHAEHVRLFRGPVKGSMYRGFQGRREAALARVGVRRQNCSVSTSVVQSPSE